MQPVLQDWIASNPIESHDKDFWIARLNYFYTIGQTYYEHVRVVGEHQYGGLQLPVLEYKLRHGQIQIPRERDWTIWFMDDIEILIQVEVAAGVAVPLPRFMHRKLVGEHRFDPLVEVAGGLYPEHDGDNPRNEFRIATDLPGFLFLFRSVLQSLAIYRDAPEPVKRSPFMLEHS